MRRAHSIIGPVLAATVALAGLAGAAQAQTVIGAPPEPVQAARDGNYEQLRDLLVRGANPNLAQADGVTLLMHAARNHDDAMIDLLVSRGAQVDLTDRQGDGALHWAVRSRAHASVEALLALGANPNLQNRQGETPTMLAVREGDRRIVERILAAEPDLTINDYTGRSLMDVARTARDPGIADMLRRAGAPD